jgi:hypothetical protein
MDEGGRNSDLRGGPMSRLKIDEVEKAGPASAWLRPDTRVVDRPDWFQVTTPSSRDFWHNGVSRSILRDEDEARATIARVAAGYRANGQGFRWIAGPSSRPTGLEALLEAANPTRSYGAHGMVAEVDRLAFGATPGIRVERIDLARVDDYVSVSTAGWGNAPRSAESMHADMVRSLGDPAHRTEYFVAYIDGTPVAAGGLLPLGRSGYLLGGSVDPSFRGRGAYRALLAHRIERLRQARVPLVTIQAMAETSAPICARLGFEAVCELRSFVWEEPK